MALLIGSRTHINLIEGMEHAKVNFISKEIVV